MDVRPEPLSHVPFLSAWCAGKSCLRCPRPWRYWVTGMELNGRQGDNATFLHAATKDYRGKPVEKLTKARWRRVARRHAATTVPGTLAAGTGGPIDFLWPDWIPMAYVGVLVPSVLAWAAWTAVAAWHTRAVNKLVDPAAETLCATVGHPYRKKTARQLIQLPKGWRPDLEEAVSVRVLVPTAKPLSAAQRKALVSAVGGRLGIPDAVGSWFEAGERITVDITGTPLPPKKVTLDDVRPAIAAASDEEVVVGLKAGRKPVVVSLAEDSPHFAMSGPSGTGKSVLIRLFMAQRLALGDGAIFLDPKRWSHWRWASKLPAERAVYAYRVQDLHDAWLKIGEELERRIELDEEELADLRRVFVVIEEINRQTVKLARYWKGERKRIIAAAKAAMEAELDYDEADLDPPAQSPAIAAMQDCVGMGREMKMHAVVAAQRLSAAVFGGNGGDVRESFQGGRFIAGWDRKLWAMLVATIAYVACPNGKRGQWGLARGENFDIFRVPFITEPEALDMATSGVQPTGPVLGGQRTRTRVVQEHGLAVHVSRWVKLSEAVGQLPPDRDGQPVTLKALQLSRDRDPNFPRPVPGHEPRPGVAGLYELDALVDWQDGRVAIGRG